MEQYISPAVRTLDYGYQAPNAIDYTRAGQAMAEPYQQAVANVGQQRNQLAVERMAGQNMLAAEQARGVLQEHMAVSRDKRLMDLINLRNQGQLADIHAKAAEGRLSSQVANASSVLVNQLGGQLPPGDPSSPDYLQKLNTAMNNQRQANVQALGQHLATIGMQKQVLTQQMQDATNNPKVQDLLTKADQQGSQDAPGLTALTFAKAHGGMNLTQVVNDDPANKDAYMQEYASEMQLNKNQAAQQYIREAGPEFAKLGVSASQLVAWKDQLATLDEDEKSSKLTQGLRGIPTQKPWAQDAQNYAQDIISGKVLSPDGKTPLAETLAPGWTKFHAASQGQQLGSDATTSKASNVTQPNWTGYSGDIRALKEVPSSQPSFAPPGVTTGPVAPMPNLTQAPVTFANSGLVGVTRNAIQQAPGMAMSALAPVGSYIDNRTQLGGMWQNFIHPPMPAMQPTAAGPNPPGFVSVADMGRGVNRFLFGTNGMPVAPQAPQPNVVMAPPMQQRPMTIIPAPATNMAAAPSYPQVNIAPVGQMNPMMGFYNPQVATPDYGNSDGSQMADQVINQAMYLRNMAQ